MVDSSQPTKSPEKDKEITPKPTREAGDPIPVETPVAEEPAGDLPENVTEVHYPYTVREYEGGLEIEVTQFRIFETVYFESEWLLGELTNTGTVNLYNITNHVLAVDENGEELLRSFASVDMVDFPVGAKTASSMPFRGDGIQEGTDHLHILFDGREGWEGTNLTQEYDVLSATGVLEEDGDYIITVGFQSTGEWPTREVAIGAILYNQEGRIVGRCESGISEWGDAHLKQGNGVNHPKLWPSLWRCRSLRHHGRRTRDARMTVLSSSSRSELQFFPVRTPCIPAHSRK